MGPPTNVDGEAEKLGYHAQLADASMGPPTNVDGEMASPLAEAGRPAASMGPPTNVDGERSDVPSWLVRARSFNGAADKRRRRASGGGGGGVERECFNGAADKRRRRGVPRMRLVLWLPSLQWGRRQTSTERASWSSELAHPPVTLQWGRRQTSTERYELCRVPGHRIRASMGPPTNVDGESRKATGAVSRIAPLQWGRRQTSTESLVE